MLVPACTNTVADHGPCATGWSISPISRAAACIGRGQAWPSRARPRPRTPEPPGRARQWRYADGVIDQRRSRWIGVREDHTVDGEPVNAIVAVDFGGSSGPGHVLASGHDFYASPRLSPDGRWLAWLAWDHPNMPRSGQAGYLCAGAP